MKHLVALLVATAIVAPAALAAHEGHNHKVMGTVSAIHDLHLEVKDAKGKVTTHTIAATTKIRRDKVMVKATDIKVGDRVVVTSREAKDKAGKLVTSVLDIQIGGTATVTAATKK